MNTSWSEYAAMTYVMRVRKQVVSCLAKLVRHSLDSLIVTLVYYCYCFCFSNLSQHFHECFLLKDSWYFITFHNISWHFMTNHDILWQIMTFHDLLWHYNDILWQYNDISMSWKSSKAWQRTGSLLSVLLTWWLIWNPPNLAHALFHHLPRGCMTRRYPFWPRSQSIRPNERKTRGVQLKSEMWEAS